MNPDPASQVPIWQPLQPLTPVRDLQPQWPAIVQEAPDYFRTNQARLRYTTFRSQGYPIGSGTVESAANTVVHHRLRRPGRGWARTNRQAMLAGLSELHSGRFEYTWLRLAKN